jgi:DNA replication licensing factor MCM3
LAAANPVYGRYDPSKTPMENIGLQDSLLSRFDLLFVMLDTIDIDNDKKIADHVVGVHRYRSSKESDGMVTDVGGGLNELDTDRGATEKDGKLTIWDKPNRLLHSGAKSREKFLSAEFIKKYVSYVKEQSRPVLTEKACDLIGEEYSHIRSQVCEGTDVAKTQPITARCLETMIRLATAHAKARLSKTVDKKDAEVAISLVQFAYFKKVLRKRKTKRQHDDDEDDEEAESENESEVEMDADNAAGPSTSGDAPPSPKRSRKSAEVSKELLTLFKKKLSSMFTSSQQIEMDSVLKTMVEEKVCSKDEVMDCIEKMSDDNLVMLSGGILYWI